MRSTPARSARRPSPHGATGWPGTASKQAQSSCRSRATSSPTTGIGRGAQESAKLASLSKAITAVCALKALDAAGLTHFAKLSEIIPDELATHPPGDDRFADITIGQLMTHTSGIQSRYHRDNLEKLKTFGKENKSWQFSKFVTEDLAARPGSAQFHYSNANYLTLGLAIEALSGEAYEPYCTREILAPAGVTTADLDETWTVMSSWGGWRMSAADYLKFAEYHFRGDHPGRPAGISGPSVNAGRGASYGAGVFFRRTGEGFNVWHLGSWRWRGRIDDRFGAYLALYDNGFSVSTNYAHDAYDGQSGELDAALWRATHPQ